MGKADLDAMVKKLVHLAAKRQGKLIHPIVRNENDAFFDSIIRKFIYAEPKPKGFKQVAPPLPKPKPVPKLSQVWLDWVAENGLGSAPHLMRDGTLQWQGYGVVERFICHHDHKVFIDPCQFCGWAHDGWPPNHNRVVKPTRRCLKCRGQGHGADNCPEAELNRDDVYWDGGRDVFCRECHQEMRRRENQLVFDCPDCNRFISQRTVETGPKDA